MALGSPSLCVRFLRMSPVMFFSQKTRGSSTAFPAMAVGLPSLCVRFLRMSPGFFFLCFVLFVLFFFK